MNNGFIAFRATSTFKDPTDYLNWLTKVEKVKAQAWKDIGIYDLIMLSKLNLNYNTPMLISSLYFWDSTYYTFHLPCGMATPTLFDMASTHIAHYHDKDTNVISDMEYIAFLALCLSHSIFFRSPYKLPRSILLWRTNYTWGTISA